MKASSLCHWDVNLHQLPPYNRQHYSGQRSLPTISRRSLHYQPYHTMMLHHRYGHVQPLADGGMAQVYRAYHRKLHQHVALKVLPAEFRDDLVMLERFRLETLRLYALHHPHIVLVARHVDEIIFRALDPEPNQRYGSAGLLAAAFRAAVSGSRYQPSSPVHA